ncbi:phosphopantetheine-binding protein [Streptomyces sp. NPDC018584]|uniref:phosphopantetheine-binding protein n=1 Tax=unclassified Streptomyces TaxID=2593676 RepID=UPI0037B55932
MPREPQIVLAAAPAAHDADVLAQIVRMLADVLRVKPEKIDPQHTFRTCEVDSLLAMEYVATVNAYYGTAIRPAALIDHPTPQAFARYVAHETASAPAGTVPAPPTAVPMPSMAASATPAPVSRFSEPTTPVLDVLREEIARILCCDPWDVDTDESFPSLGVDTELAGEFVSVINLVYGLRERPGVLYDHPNLRALAAHIVARLPMAGPGAAVQARAAGPTPLEELLDAVRDGRVSVDQALALLPRKD